MSVTSASYHRDWLKRFGKLALLASFTNEFSLDSEPPIIVVFARLCGAALLCALIGYERESRNHAAGLRTNMLVGLAAATFAIITIGTTTYFSDQESLRMDPLRLINAVTSGVAFLAAGLIVFAQGQVHGLTTGASVWLSASIGLAVGLGLWFVAALSTFVGLMILTAMRFFEPNQDSEENAEE